jgi:organic radical activating enzyme
MKTIAVEHSWHEMDSSVRIEWNLGKRCNYNCSYCDQLTHDNFSDFLSFEAAKNTIDKIMEKCRDKRIRISLTGGEPTINPSFLNIIKYMKEAGVSFVSVTTNGSRTREFYIQAMEYLDNIIFSYHMEYLDRKKYVDAILACNEYIQKNPKKRLHVHVMMLPTMFNEAVLFMETLKKNDIKTVMRRIRPAFKVDHKENIYEDGRLVDGVIAEPFYAGPTTLLFYKGNSKAGPNCSKDKDYYSDEENVFLTENRVKSLSRQTNGSVKTKNNAGSFVNVITYTESDATEENVNDILVRKENSYIGWKCWSGVQTLMINSQDNVFNATCQAAKFGNIRTGFDIPAGPTICTKQWCLCAADLNTTKIKDDIYQDKIRII